jgi:hypothetical protein
VERRTAGNLYSVMFRANLIHSARASKK